MPAIGTTSLPDEDQPTLGNGVEDEVAVDRESAVSNYGDVRIQIRETGQSAWDSSATGFGEFIGNYDTLSMEFVDREDGEEYEVRARTETEHKTGDWTQPVSITTKFPGVTSLTTTGATKTSVDLEAVDNADNESGIIVERQREYSSGWGPWREVADLPAQDSTGTFTTVDDSASPGNTYRYRAVPYTEHTAATSEPTESVSTLASGRPRTRTGSTGWTVEIDHPDADSPLRPRLLDDPQQQPRVNDLPRLRIPVPYSEKWHSEAFEDAPMRVWKDGVRQPIDTLVDTTMETRQGSKRSILHGRGGSELKTTVTDEFDLRDLHTAAGDLIESNTPYRAVVDAPDESYRRDVVMKTIDSQSDWEGDPVNDIPAESPEEFVDGRYQPKQASFTMEGDAAGVDTDAFEYYSLGAALVLADLATFGPWTFTLDYDVPAGEAGLAVRFRTQDDQDNANHGFTLYLDGSEVFSTPANGLSGDLGWFPIPVSTGVSAGEHEIELETTAFGDADELYLDLVNFHDTRYFEASAFPNDNGGFNQPLPGPRDYPVMSRAFADASTGQQIVGGRLDATVTDTSGQQAVAISNDQGQSWTEAANSTVVDTEFADASSRLRARFTVGAYGERDDATPRQGFQPQAVDAYDLYADLDETPAVINQSVDNHLDRVLRDWADQGGFIWEYRLDETGTPVVVWTQPGQRETSVDPELVDFRVRKRTGEVYEDVTVVGASTGVTGERFFANTGDLISLVHEYLVDGSETVYDPSDGTNYARGADYEISYLDGEITVLSGGSMTDGEQYAVDYRYETRGSYALDSVDDPREAPKKPIPGLTSPEACEQAAATIVNEVSEPLWEVEFTVSPGDLGWQVSDALQVGALPVDKPVEVRQVENSPSEIAVTGGTRQTVEAVVRQIRERVDQVSRRT